MLSPCLDELLYIAISMTLWSYNAVSTMSSSLSTNYHVALSPQCHHLSPQANPRCCLQNLTISLGKPLHDTIIKMPPSLLTSHHMMLSPQCYNHSWRAIAWCYLYNFNKPLHNNMSTTLSLSQCQPPHDISTTPPSLTWQVITQGHHHDGAISLDKQLHDTTSTMFPSFSRSHMSRHPLHHTAISLDEPWHDAISTALPSLMTSNHTMLSPQCRNL